MIIRPPWNHEQVEALKARQADTRLHPYTCPGDRPECIGQRDLVPTPEGWVCQCGNYRQQWAKGAA